MTMSWLSDLITKAVEENWCTSSMCGLCMNQGFRKLVRERPREEVISDLRTLSQEICDLYPDILRTVFMDISIFKTGFDLVEPIKDTPAGAVLASSMHHAKVRYEISRGHAYFCSPEAAMARAELRRQRIAENQKLRLMRKADLNGKLMKFRNAIEHSDFNSFFSELQLVSDPLVVRAVGGLSYSLLRDRLRRGGLDEEGIEIIKRCALNYGGHWAKLINIK